MRTRFFLASFGSAVLAILAVFAAGGSPTASGHEADGHDTYSTSICSASAKDPQNVRFHMDMSAATSVTATGGYTSLVYAGSGSTQYFWDHSSCRSMFSIQPSSDSFPLPPVRYHERLSQGRDSSHIDGMPYTAAAGHLDVLTYCGHYVPSSGFNSTRDHIHSSLSRSGGLYTPHWVWKGNTLGITQCNLVVASSDGWVSEIDG